MEIAEPEYNRQALATVMRNESMRTRPYMAFRYERIKRWFSGPALCTLCLLISGCTTYGNISNKSLSDTQKEKYTLSRALNSARSDDVTIVLAFSGGGSRAAALSYGVLAALRDTKFNVHEKPGRLIDEVDAISSVSGGSFTAAYYGLYGDRIFKDYEKEFLRRNITGELINGLFNPLQWFSSRGRTEMAVEYYEERVFKGATFADLLQEDGPLIVINASDLGSGVRFSFIQEYFDLLCSDLSSFPVARAVTASSALPIVFNPVILENHPGCVPRAQQWLEVMQQKKADSPQIFNVIEGLRSYALKDERQYIHLADGGITDNLGLMAIYEMVEVSGGVKQFLHRLEADPAPHFLVISVNASTSPQYDMESSNKIPSFETTINVVSDVQLHRYNSATLQLFKDSMKRWSKELSTKEQKVIPYFVEIDFNSLQHKGRRFFFNQIPANFSLNKEQVDNLIKVGRELLLKNPEYLRFLGNMQQ